MARITIELNTDESSTDLSVVSGLSELFIKANGLSISSHVSSDEVVALPQEPSTVEAPASTVAPPPAATKTTTTTRRKANTSEEKVAETAVQVVDTGKGTLATVVSPPAETKTETVAPPPASTVAPPSASTVAPPPAAAANVAPPPATAEAKTESAPSFTRISNRLVKAISPGSSVLDVFDAVKLKEFVAAIGVKNGLAGLRNASEDDLMTLESMVETFLSDKGLELPA